MANIAELCFCGHARGSHSVNEPHACGRCHCPGFRFDAWTDEKGVAEGADVVPEEAEGTIKEDPRLPGLVYFNCPNCNTQFGIAPQISAINIHRAYDTILVEFAEVVVDHECPRDA